VPDHGHSAKHAYIATVGAFFLTLSLYSLTRRLHCSCRRAVAVAPLPTATLLTPPRRARARTAALTRAAVPLTRAAVPLTHAHRARRARARAAMPLARPHRAPRPRPSPCPRHQRRAPPPPPEGGGRLLARCHRRPVTPRVPSSPPREV
jgi:hypothetical protein